MLFFEKPAHCAINGIRGTCCAQLRVASARRQRWLLLRVLTSRHSSSPSAGTPGVVATAPSSSASVAAAIAARQPTPDSLDGSRALYRPAVPKSMADRLFGRWRGQPIDLNHDHDMWARRDSSSRHLRSLLWTFRSETFRRLLFPDMAITCAVSSAVVAHNMWVAWENAHNVFPVEQSGFNLLLHHDMVSLPPEPFTFSAFALGLILAFRTNTSHARYVEARTILGNIINLSRDMTSRFTASKSHSEAGQQAQRRAVALVSTFAHTMKYHLTVDGCNQQINSTDAEHITRSLREELVLIWAPLSPGQLPEANPQALSYIDALLAPDVTHRPLHVLHELGRLSRSEELGLEPVAAAQLDDRLYSLINAVGGCERIFRTPIYTPYSDHLSRFLFLWCCGIPLAMYPLVGPFGTIPVSAVLTYFMLGIEDVGIRTEQPFDVLPLWQYVEAIDASCAQILNHRSESTR